MSVHPFEVPSTNNNNYGKEKLHAPA